MQDITAAANDNGFTVYIEQIFCNRYKIEKIENDEDEIIYYGEKSEKYNGALGDNLIKITLYDTKLSDKWKSKYSMYEIYNFDNIYPDTDGGV